MEMIDTLTADCEPSSASQARSTPTPNGVTAPRPVTTTRRVGAAGGSAKRSCDMRRTAIDLGASIFMFHGVAKWKQRCGTVYHHSVPHHAGAQDATVSRSQRARVVDLGP